MVFLTSLNSNNLDIYGTSEILVNLLRGNNVGQLQDIKLTQSKRQVVDIKTKFN